MSLHVFDDNLPPNSALEESQRCGLFSHFFFTPIQKIESQSQCRLKKLFSCIGQIKFSACHSSINGFCSTKAVFPPSKRKIRVRFSADANFFLPFFIIIIYYLFIFFAGIPYAQGLFCAAKPECRVSCSASDHVGKW